MTDTLTAGQLLAYTTVALLNVLANPRASL